MFSYWARPEHGLDLARFLNDHIGGLVEAHPGRFVGLGTVPLQAPDLAIQELDRCVRELGLAGVQIGTHVNDWNLDAPELFPFFEAAEALGAALFVHPWDMLGKERMSKYWLPWLVGMPTETALAICSLVFSRRFRTPAEAQDRLRPRRRCLPGPHRAHRARLPRAPGPVRRGLPGESPRVAHAPLCGCAGARTAHAALSIGPHGPRAHRAGLGLSVPARRATSGPAHRVGRTRCADHGTPPPRHRVGVARPPEYGNPS